MIRKCQKDTEQQAKKFGKNSIKIRLLFSYTANSVENFQFYFRTL